MGKIIDKIFKTVFALVSALSISILSRTNFVIESKNVIEQFNICLNYISIEDELIFLFVLFFFIKIKFKYDIYSIILGIMFALFSIIGKSYWEFGNWDFILKNQATFVVAFICFLGIWFIYSLIIQCFFCFLQKKNILCFQSEEKHIDKYFELKCFVILILSWIPYIWINLPGSVPYDGYRQLNMALGIQKMTNHHPYIISLFLGMIFSLGRMKNDNFGVFLIVVFNALFSASVFTYIVNRIKKWKLKRKIYMFIVLFFALVPAWGSYIQAVIKDTIYFPLFCLYFITYIDLFEKLKKGQKLNRLFVAKYVIISVLLMTARNNGFYIVLPATLITLVISNKKNIAYLSLIILLLISINEGYHRILLPMNNVEEGGIQEMLSLPFQQTARFAKYYGNELSEEDKRVIDHILDYNQIAEKYNPDKADPVKDTIRKEITKDEWKSYVKVYLKMLRKHPGVFVQATINNMYGYFYPPYRCRVLLSYNYYIEKKPQVATGDLNIHYHNDNSRWRKNLSLYSDLWQLTPGLSLLQSPGFYTWLLMLIIVMLLKFKRFKEMIVTSVPLLHVAICMLSPVNGLLRYAMPLMGIMPILLCWVLKILYEETSVNG